MVSKLLHQIFPLSPFSRDRWYTIDLKSLNRKSFWSAVATKNHLKYFRILHVWEVFLRQVPWRVVPAGVGVGAGRPGGARPPAPEHCGHHHHGRCLQHCQVAFLPSYIIDSWHIFWKTKASWRTYLKLFVTCSVFTYGLSLTTVSLKIYFTIRN